MVLSNMIATLSRQQRRAAIDRKIRAVVYLFQF